MQKRLTIWFWEAIQVRPTPKGSDEELDSWNDGGKNGCGVLEVMIAVDGEGRERPSKSFNRYEGEESELNA